MTMVGVVIAALWIVLTIFPRLAAWSVTSQHFFSFSDPLHFSSGLSLDFQQAFWDETSRAY